MLIAIDIDEVLSNTVVNFINFYNKEYKKDYIRTDFYHYLWWEVVGISEQEFLKVHEKFRKSSYYSSMKPVKGSKDGINELKKEHELELVTSRPVFMKEMTEKWLKKYFPNIFNKIHFAANNTFSSPGPTKGEICLEIKADLLIEDQLDYCEECLHNGTRVFLYDCPWNQHIEEQKKLTRVYNWPEVVKRIKNNDYNK